MRYVIPLTPEPQRFSIPLVAGCDLLEPYAYLGLGGALLLSGDEPPSPDTLGRGVDLLFEVADHG